MSRSEQIKSHNWSDPEYGTVSMPRSAINAAKSRPDIVLLLPDGRFEHCDLGNEIDGDDGSQPDEHILREHFKQFRNDDVVEIVTRSTERKKTSQGHMYRVRDGVWEVAKETIENRDSSETWPCGHPGIDHVDDSDRYTCGKDWCDAVWEREQFGTDVDAYSDIDFTDSEVFDSHGR